MNKMKRNQHQFITNISTKIMSSAWIVFVVFFLPFLIPLIVYVRKTALRLPEALGEKAGHISPRSDKTEYLTFIGESPVVGVGVENQNEGIVASTALHLSKRNKCGVKWTSVGKNGISIEGAKILVSKLNMENIDYLVICLGVNDTTQLSSLSKWYENLTSLIDIAKSKYSCHILVAGIPPMEQFTALPFLLRWAFGFRAKILNRVTNSHHYNGLKFNFMPSNYKFFAGDLAMDGYHPSKKGCHKLGDKIAQYIAIINRKS